jgi:DNA-directed RNA polymerase sigma subunit (sigma70/sigma32)
MARATALPILSAESGLSRYLEEIRRFPMLEPQEEYMLAKSWREHGDRDAAHRLVTSHLRLVAKIAMGYRGYGLPISEAKRLGVPEQDVIDMNRRLGGDASLNAPIREDGDAGEWQDWLVDESASQESRLVADEQADNRRKALTDALSVLNERERRIFEARRLAEDPITLEDLAEEFGVSRERVRQIEVRAFEKVQKAVKNRVAAMESPPTQPQLAMH